MSGMEKWEHLKISFQNIKDATNDFRKTIGKGGYGSVYEGELLINGRNVKVAVKRLNEQFGQGFKEFLTEIQLLSGQRHENIITLVGYCDEGKEKIIVYEYAQRGSLDQYIRRSDTNYTLTWLERLKIVTDAARGLEHLHNHGTQHKAVIHRDIKCSNILLDHNWVAKISDLGLSKLTTSGLGASTVISRACGTLHYLEPEYIRTGMVTKKSDVFSFGMVLFEVLCGRLCYVRDADGILLLANVAKEYYANHKLDRIIDPILREQMSRESLRRYSAIAYKCLQDRKHRPLMDVVTKELETTLKIQNNEAASTSTILCPQPENIEDSKIPLEVLKMATQDFSSGAQIGYGGFGTVYKGKLPERWQNRMAAIKRFTPGIEARNDVFHHERQFTFNFRHENIIPFIGYCDEENEMIIVTEYAVNGSLDYHIRDPEKRCCLTWEQRLKICLGAAKGLKHLHSGHGEYNKVIHRDVKSSSILLDENMEAKICGLGLSRSPKDQVTKIISGTQFYMDPIYSESGKLRTASDVYSFGVVLFEMLSGRMAYNAIEPEDEVWWIHTVRDYKGALPDNLIDPCIKDKIGDCSFITLKDVAYECISLNYKKRPIMDTIIDRIQEALEYLNNEAASTSTILCPQPENIEDFKIPLEVLKMATRDFSSETQIGNGGFGIVYKGILPERWQNRTAAIKRLNPGNEERNDVFQHELQFTSNFRHENIIPFIGYCDEENEMIIVTEYAVNGSLDYHILDDPEMRCRLTWEQRLKICLGAAKGLKHLHSGHGEYNKVIHRDVKSSSILLDENMEAKICGLGLSRSPKDQVTKIISGTQFYMDPIYSESGKLRTASDVYSFGVVLFEMLSGRMAYNEIEFEDGEMWLIYIFRHYKGALPDNLIDPCIKDKIDDRSFITLQDIAYECISLNYKKRPIMDTIIHRIQEALEYLLSKKILSKAE